MPLGSLPPRAFPSPVHAGTASAGRPRGQPDRGSAGPGVTRRRVAAGAGGVAGARRPVPLPSVSWRAPGLSPPLRHSVGRCDTLPLSSMARRRPAASDRRPGLGMRSAGARSLSPAGPPLCGPAAAGSRSRRCGAARPLLPFRDAATTSGREAWRGAGRGARARVGQWGRLGMPLAVRGRIDG